MADCLLSVGSVQGTNSHSMLIAMPLVVVVVGAGSMFLLAELVRPLCTNLCDCLRWRHNCDCSYGTVANVSLVVGTIW
jgi:hypothetical protein